MRFGLHTARAHAFDPALGFAGRTVIGIPADGGNERRSRRLDEATEPARVTVRLAEVPSRRAAARAGSGVTLPPCFLGDGDPTPVAIGTPVPELTGDIRMPIHPDLGTAPAVRAVAAAIVRTPAERP